MAIGVSSSDRCDVCNDAIAIDKIYSYFFSDYHGSMPRNIHQTRSRWEIHYSRKK